MLASIPWIEVACSTGSPEVARAAMVDPPDVLIISTSLVERLDSLMQLPDEVRILGLIPGESPDHLLHAALLEADGYAMEATLSVEELRQAMLRVLNREIPVPPQLSKHLLSHARNGSSVPRRSALTPREQQVLALLADGLTNKEVARRLGISENGAKRHVASILTKLNTPSRAGAVAIAFTERMLDPRAIS